MSEHSPLRVAVIGGGYTGTIFLRHLLDRATRPLALTVFEPRLQLGRGVAYDVTAPNLLLNVPTTRMMPWLDRPMTFHDWTLEIAGWPASEAEPDGGIYTTRFLFGVFTEVMLRQGLEQSRQPFRFDHRLTDVVGLDRLEQGFRLRGSDGVTVEVDAVTLAMGNPTPRSLRQLCDWDGAAPEILDDVWYPDALASIPRDAPVGIVGTGLTMADMISSLDAAGHRGPITALSRRGLVPHEMRNTIVRIDRAKADSYPTSAADLVHVVRERFERALAEQGDWRFAMDRVRLDIPLLWRAMPELEKRRLQRWARPFWDIHRFRMPPATHRIVEASRNSGRLRIENGQLTGLKQGAMLWRARGGGDGRFACSHVLNCTGPDYSYEARCAGLLADLHRQRLMRDRHPVSGFALDDHDRLIPAAGEAPPAIFGLGPVARARYGELTTATEISAQAAGVASFLAGVAAT